MVDKHTPDEVDFSLSYPQSAVEEFKKWRDERDALKEETAKLREAVGMFLNGMAYYSTFPDNDDDAKYLKKQATWNFLQARNHIPEYLAGLCNEASKDFYAKQALEETGDE